MVQKGRRNANTFERSRQEVEGRKMRKMRKRGWRRIKRGEGGRRRFLDRERILLTVARAEFGRVGGPANNAGLVFLNPRTNRHLSGAGEMAGHSARCGSRCSRAHLSLFFLFTRPSENDLTVPGARASERAGERASRDRARRSSNELSTLPDRRNARLPLEPPAGKNGRDRGPRYRGLTDSPRPTWELWEPWLP